MTPFYAKRNAKLVRHCSGKRECERLPHAPIRLEGFEPPTYGSVGRCSIQLSYRRFFDCKRITKTRKTKVRIGTFSRWVMDIANTCLSGSFRLFVFGVFVILWPALPQYRERRKSCQLARKCRELAVRQPENSSIRRGIVNPGKLRILFLSFPLFREKDARRLHRSQRFARGHLIFLSLHRIRSFQR